MTGVHCGGSGIPAQFLWTSHVRQARNNIFSPGGYGKLPLNTNSYYTELELKYYCPNILTYCLESCGLYEKSIKY